KPEELHEEVFKRRQRLILEETVAELAKLSPLEYDQVRVEKAQALGVRQKTLNDEVEKVRHGAKVHESGEASESLSPLPPEPWEHEVNGGTLLDEIHKFIGRFVAVTSDVLVTLTLWVVFTYLLDIVDTSPRLAILSPTKRCGKTLVLSILSAL